MNTTNILKTLLLLSLFFLYTKAFSQENRIQIDTDFPGGNIIVEQDEIRSTEYYTITSDTVLVRPDLRDTEGDWFYWYFRVTGAAGKTLHFQFPDRDISSFGPAFFSNKNGSWQWLYDDVSESHDHFSYTFGPNENEVKFSATIPYLQQNFENFISAYTNNPYLSIGTLTVSKQGRKIEKLSIRNPNQDPIYKVLITARHHANEAMASYALEGLITSALDGENESSKWLRENVEFLIVPFMDKDGVQDGDQGKNRKPRDHNRDYSGDSIYNSTAALREIVPQWSEGKLRVGFDMHCPGIVGEWHEHIYFVGSENEQVAAEQSKFVDILVDNHNGELKVLPEKSYLEFGTSWNVGQTFDAGYNFRKWASTLEDISLAVSMELPFSNNAGQQVTPRNARTFGKDLADAISIYMQNL